MRTTILSLTLLGLSACCTIPDALREKVIVEQDVHAGYLRAFDADTASITSSGTFRAAISSVSSADLAATPDSVKAILGGVVTSLAKSEQLLSNARKALLMSQQGWISAGFVLELNDAALTTEEDESLGD